MVVGDNGAILQRKDSSTPMIVLHFSSMNPHVGQKLEARLVDKATGVEVSRKTVAAIPSPDFSVTFDNITSGQSYWIDFYADHNGNGSYDAPPADHAWRLEANNVNGEHVVTFVHSTNFTDIQWPGSSTNVADDDDSQLGLPREFELSPNYPNPFNPETNIRFALPNTAEVKLEIYNLLGQRVRLLVSGLYNSGVHTARWDGKDDAGRSLGSGVYFYRIEAGQFNKTQRMVMMK